MTLIYLIRHAHHDLLGQALVGRGEVSLSREGRDQAERLGRRLAAKRLTAVLSSPRQRTLETARPIAAAAGLDIEIAPAIDEVDFGEWTGRRFAALDGDPRWRDYDRHRDLRGAPGGESLHDVQGRLVAFLEALAGARTDAQVALVSHGDPIRAALLHYLGMPLPLVHRLEVAPASISMLIARGTERKLLACNLCLDDW